MAVAGNACGVGMTIQQGTQHGFQGLDARFQGMQAFHRRGVGVSHVLRRLRGLACATVLDVLFLLHQPLQGGQPVVAMQARVDDAPEIQRGPAHEPLVDDMEVAVGLG